MGDLDTLIREVLGNPLDRKEEKVLHQLIKGEIKLQYGDPKQTEIIKKLNEFYSKIEDAGHNKEEIIEAIDDRIESCEGTIEDLERQIRNEEDEIYKMKEAKKRIQKM